MKKRFIGYMIVAIIAVVLAVILTFNLLQPLVNAGIQSTTSNFSSYAGAGALVGTIPLFSALLLVIAAISALFLVLRATGIVA